METSYLLSIIELLFRLTMFNKAIIAALGSSLVASESFTGPMRADQYELVEWPYLNGQPGFGPKELGMIVVASERNQRELGFTLLGQNSVNS